MADRKIVKDSAHGYSWDTNPPQSATGEEVLVISNPPPGCKKILNIWRDVDGNLSYEFEK